MQAKTVANCATAVLKINLDGKQNRAKMDVVDFVNPCCPAVI